MSEDSAFLCPQCGQTIFDVSATKIAACSHLRYAGYSEAPGNPDFIDVRLSKIRLSSCDERENVRRIKASLGERAQVFELDDEHGDTTLFLAFETTERQTGKEREKMLEKPKTRKLAKGFREVRPDELVQVSSIADACFSKIGIDAVGNNRVRQWEPTRKLWDTKALTEHFTTPSFNLAVMTVGNEVVGYASFLETKRAMVIDELAVSPKHWHKGYGSYMVRILNRTLHLGMQDPNAPKVLGVKVGEKNLAALLFFRSCGFRWVKTIPNSLAGYDTYVMQLDGHC